MCPALKCWLLLALQPGQGKSSGGRGTLLHRTARTPAGLRSGRSLGLLCALMAEPGRGHGAGQGARSRGLGSVCGHMRPCSAPRGRGWSTDTQPGAERWRGALAPLRAGSAARPRPCAQPRQAAPAAADSRQRSSQGCGSGAQLFVLLSLLLPYSTFPGATFALLMPGSPCRLLPSGAHRCLLCVLLPGHPARAELCAPGAVSAPVHKLCWLRVRGHTAAGWHLPRRQGFFPRSNSYFMPSAVCPNFALPVHLTHCPASPHVVQFPWVALVPVSPLPSLSCWGRGVDPVMGRTHPASWKPGQAGTWERISSSFLLWGSRALGTVPRVLSFPWEQEGSGVAGQGRGSWAEQHL